MSVPSVPQSRLFSEIGAYLLLRAAATDDAPRPIRPPPGARCWWPKRREYGETLERYPEGGDRRSSGPASRCSGIVASLRSWSPKRVITMERNQWSRSAKYAQGNGGRGL